MKRCLFTACLCLVLGTLVNVPDAWGIALFGPARRLQPVSFKIAQWPVDVPADWPPPRDGGILAAPGIRHTWGWAPQLDAAGRQVDYYRCETSAYGWPMSALWHWNRALCSSASGAVVKDQRQSPVIDLGKRFGRVGAPSLRLPIVPLWPGLIINAVFYGAIIYAVAFLIASLRRTTRRRGRCPACGYPVGNSQVHTECGRRIKIVPP